MIYEVFIGVFLLTLFFVYLVKKYAPVLGFVDIPNTRSMHITDTPRGAGVGFFFAIVFVLSYAYTDVLYEFVWVNIAIWMVFFMGVWDDYNDSSPYIKFIVFIVATIFLSYDNLLIHTLGIYFGADLSLGWVALPFTVFAVVGFTNAINLIDGLDGLAASISIIIFSTFYFIGYENNDMFMMLLSGAFIAGLLAFLIYNWTPASVFMGDSGSLTTGFVLSVLAIKSLTYIPAISIFYIGAIPIMDTLIVMTRRKMHGKSMVAGDRCHMHHLFKFVFSGNTAKTILFLVLLQVGYTLIGLYFINIIDDGYLLILFIFNIILFYRLLDNIAKKQRRDC